MSLGGGFGRDEIKKMNFGGSPIQYSMEELFILDETTRSHMDVLLELLTTSHNES